MKRFVRTFALILVAALVAAACASTIKTTTTSTTAVPGDTDDPTTSNPDDPDVKPVALDLADRAAPTTAPNTAGVSIDQLGSRLLAAARAEDADRNISLSPTSIAIALAMLEPGASGTAQTELRALLGIDDPTEYHASMNALEQHLESLEPYDYGEDQDPGDLLIRIANAAYLQQGYPFNADYLDVVGANYGSALNEVDFPPNPDAVAHEINDFIAEATEDRIVDLIPDGAITSDTVLALVNALYLKASWQDPFMETIDDTPFALADGSEVAVPMMVSFSDASTAGDGWVGATKVLGGGLVVELILPGEGNFAAIADGLDQIPVGSFFGGGEVLQVPRFETRTNLPLSNILKSLGMNAAFEEGGLLGIANDPTTKVDDVLHEAFVAFDEEGVEAAAATVVLVSATSAPPPGVPVILDRPFLYRIVDQTSGAVLFVGQIMNPTQ